MSELSPEALMLLESEAEADASSQQDRQRIKQRLVRELGASAFALTAAGATQVSVSNAVASASSSLATGQTTTPVAVGAPASATGTTGLLGAMIKLALVLSVVVAASVGAVLGSRSSAPLPTKAHVSARTASPLSEPTAQRALVPDAPARTDSEPSAHALGLARGNAAAPHSRARAANVGATPPRAPSVPSQQRHEATSAAELSDEVEWLARAQTALREGRARDALALVQEHEQRFPSGTLREERLGIEALARCALGANGEAVARDFLGVAAGSPLAARVRNACHLE